MRYRVVEVTFDSKDKLVVLFDPLHLDGSCYNDMHLLLKYDKKGKSVLRIPSDHLKISLKESISSLYSTCSRENATLRNRLYNYLEYEEIVDVLYNQFI